MKTDFDPRTKILIVIALTGVIVINSNLIIQCMLVSMITIMSLVFGVEILSLIKRLRRFLLLLFGLVIIQSLFVNRITSYNVCYTKLLRTQLYISCTTLYKKALNNN